MTQIGLFEGIEQNYEVEHTTTVRMGKRSAEMPLRKRRREAKQRLKEILGQLEGKDILVSSYWGSHNHFWADSLLLRRLQVEWGWLNKDLPNVLTLWGTMVAKRHQQHIRILLDQLHAVREQYDGSGKPYYLIDFWNGFGEYPLDRFRPRGYVSLVIRPAK